MRLALAPDDDIAALARAAPIEVSLTVIVAPGRDALSLALTRAAIGPLAIERAPARINTLFPASDADPADVEAAAAWLDRAESTTGQLLDVSARARTAPATR